MTPAPALSFAGAAQRLAGVHPPAARLLVTWWAWLLIAVFWYGCFAWAIVPVRLYRRSQQRRAEDVALRTRLADALDPRLTPPTNVG